MVLSGILTAISDWVGRMWDDFIPRPMKILLFTVVGSLIIGLVVSSVANYAYDCSDGKVYVTSNDTCDRALENWYAAQNVFGPVNSSYGMAAPTWTYMKMLYYKITNSDYRNASDYLLRENNMTGYVALSDLAKVPLDEVYSDYCDPYTRSSNQFLYPACVEDSKVTFTLRGARIFDPVYFTAMVVFIELAAFAIYFLKN